MEGIILHVYGMDENLVTENQAKLGCKLCW